jgi:flagellar hook-associated protein 2
VSTSSTTNVPFTGISQYADDFQSILDKAVQVAQIPVTQLQTQDTAVLSQETALGTLSSDVAAVATDVQNIGQLAANQAIGVTSSDPSAVSATATGATTAGTYTLNSITSAASAASEVSTSGVADSSNTPLSKMTLVVGGTSTSFALTSNNLNGLVQQINSLGAGVTASVVTNDGSNYLSISSSSGPESIQLYDSPTATGTDLLSNTGSGTEQSTAGYANPSSTPVSAPTFTLKSGSQTYTFQLTDGNDNLAGLENAINASGAPVTASILTTASGNYLSVQANSSGATTLALYAGSSASGTDLLTSNNQGSDAVFQLDGINIDQPGNVVNNIIPGVTFTIQGKSSSPVTLTLASDPTQLSSALQQFVTDYNTLQTALAQQVGQSGGALVGDTVVSQIQQTLQQMVSYTTSSGGVQSLADLGVEFSETGQASFDQSTFDALSQTQISDALNYLGSTTSGFGGFSQQLTQYSDPISGLIQDEITGLRTTNTNLQSQISALTTQITNMTNSMTQQYEAADAAQAELQQQQSDLNASLEGLNLVLYGRDTTSIS